MKLSVILTGATGMVGEGVLHECLADPGVEKILVVTRKPTGVTHPKLSELLHSDFQDFSAVTHRLSGYNTCFFCLGVSSMGKTEAEFTTLTYDLTMGFARILAAQNPGMTFCYISGAGTDSSEKGKTMWARLKGKTENDLQKLGFKAVYNFRPGYLHPTPGLKNTLPYYKYLSWLYPVFRLVFRPYVSTLAELGQAMLAAANNGYSKSVVEVVDIVELAKRGKMNDE